MEFLDGLKQIDMALENQNKKLQDALALCEKNNNLLLQQMLKNGVSSDNFGLVRFSLENEAKITEEILVDTRDPDILTLLESYGYKKPVDNSCVLC